MPYVAGEPQVAADAYCVMRIPPLGTPCASRISDLLLRVPVSQRYAPSVSCAHITAQTRSRLGSEIR